MKSEPRPPKPRSQGDASPSTPKAPIRGGNSTELPRQSVTKKGVHVSGVGGTGRHRNPAPKT